MRDSEAYFILQGVLQIKAAARWSLMILMKSRENVIWLQFPSWVINCC